MLHLNRWKVLHLVSNTFCHFKHIKWFKNHQFLEFFLWHLNFSNFFYAYVLLFSIAQGEWWSGQNSSRTSIILCNNFWVGMGIVVAWELWLMWHSIIILQIAYKNAHFVYSLHELRYSISPHCCLASGAALAGVIAISAVSPYPQHFLHALDTSQNPPILAILSDLVAAAACCDPTFSWTPWPDCWWHQVMGPVALDRPTLPLAESISYLALALIGQPVAHTICNTSPAC